MLKKIFVLILMGSLSLISAQTSIGKVSLLHSNLESPFNGEAEINILAVMVEFQPDEFELTYGDGTFGSIYSEDYGTNIIDPLPHNKTYFEDHLTFAKNYFSKVSDNKVSISYNVLPDTITVSNPMRDYSPLEGESFKVLADFSKEVWELVGNANSGLDFSEYNLFVIFHAGVGKDISTNDLFGEARDLPSIYLSHKSLKEFYGDSFAGFQQTDGTLITNSVILPETESREESGIGGVSLIELSINGLIVSSIASHLGLPDLFDAETGKSAIGRFGLMDGQSLFAFAGLFPPEPSAWEKIYLGWEEPVEISSSTNNIEVTASQIAQETDAKIIKIPINSTEYYLIENRARDANDNGITVTYKIGGQTRTKTFYEDLDNFNNAVVDTLNGVVIDVDEYDWALPGNGILIWHIDEKIIDAGLESNRVNIGEDRGVDLEEADGIQDIGEEFQTIFGDIVIAEGEEADFWYASNSSELYTNEFSLNSKPNTKTNSGANSLITINNFSEVGTKMSFNLSFGTDFVSTLGNLNYSGSFTDFKLTGLHDLYTPYILSGNDLLLLGSENIFNNFSQSDFAVYSKSEIDFVIGTFDNNLNIGYTSGEQFIESVSYEGIRSSQILLDADNESELKILFGTSNGNVLEYLFNLVSKSAPTLINTYSLTSNPISQIAALEDYYTVSSEDLVVDADGNEFNFSAQVRKIIITKTIQENFKTVVLTENSIYTIDRNSTNANLIYSQSSLISDISIADLKNDGSNYIIFSNQNQINAINLNGSFADNYPVTLDSSEIFVGTPIIADVDSDDYSDIIVTSSQGNIFSLSGYDGNIITGFPLSVGGQFNGDHTIIKVDNVQKLSVANTTGDFYFWEISSNGKVQWGSKFGNNMNTSSTEIAESKNYISEYFPDERTYNWPNPVYGDETFIRTYVSEDSQVKVKIFDLAGDLVDEFEFVALGGYDSEKGWNVSQVQSGAYFAHVEVKSNSGKTDSKIIKIAIVK